MALYTPQAQPPKQQPTQQSKASNKPSGGYTTMA
jgi:hypothetical protein